MAKHKDLALRIKESFDDPTIVFRIKKQPTYIKEPYKLSQVDLRVGDTVFDTIASLEIDKRKSYQKLELKIWETHAINNDNILPIITDYFDSVNKHLVNSFKK